MRHLGEALTHWKDYAAIRDAHYVPALLQTVSATWTSPPSPGQVADDLEIARKWKTASLKEDGKRGGSEKGFRE